MLHVSAPSNELCKNRPRGIENCLKSENSISGDQYRIFDAVCRGKVIGVRAVRALLWACESDPVALCEAKSSDTYVSGASRERGRINCAGGFLANVRTE